MKVHKLVYFAHGWHLALTEKPLIDETLQAWAYGPVVPSLYHEFKHFRNQDITELALDLEPTEGFKFRVFVPAVSPDDQYTCDLLNRVIKVYGKFTALELSAMTHEPSSPPRHGQGPERRTLELSTWASRTRACASTSRRKRRRTKKPLAAPFDHGHRFDRRHTSAWHSHERLHRRRISICESNKERSPQTGDGRQERGSSFEKSVCVSCLFPRGLLDAHYFRSTCSTGSHREFSLVRPSVDGSEPPEASQSGGSVCGCR